MVLFEGFCSKNREPEAFYVFLKAKCTYGHPLECFPHSQLGGPGLVGAKVDFQYTNQNSSNTIVKTQPKNVKKDPFLTAFAPKNASPKHFSSFYMRNISTEIPLSASHTFSPAGRVWWVQSWVGTKFQVDWENRGPKVGTFENVAAPKTNVKVNHFA